MSTGGAAMDTRTIRDRIWRGLRSCPRCGYDRFQIKDHYLFNRDTLVIYCWGCGRFEAEPPALLEIMEMQNEASGTHDGSI